MKEISHLLYSKNEFLAEWVRYALNEFLFEHCKTTTEIANKIREKRTEQQIKTTLREMKRK